MKKNLNTGSVLAFGELLWDVLPSGKVIGGAPANYSFRLQTMGVPVSLVSKVGNDEFGQEILRQLASRSIDTSFVQLDENYPTGTVDVVLSASGNASYTINPNVAYDFIDPTKALLQQAQQSSLICFGTLVQRSVRSRDTLHQVLSVAPSATKLVDINLRRDCFNAESVESSLKAADILKLNDDEVKTVSEMLNIPSATLDDFCSAIISRFGLESCLVTRAERGVFARSNSGESIDIPGYRVRVVDTIGSGDAFSAGFTSTYLQGGTLRECCEFGNRLGALVATTKGGMTALDTQQFDQLSASLA